MNEQARTNAELIEEISCLNQRIRELELSDSERKRMEQTLRESEEKFRILVENANDIVYSLTLDGVFTYVSPTWTRILGHDISEVENHPFQPFMHPEDLPGCLEFLERIIKTGEKQAGIEYRVIHKNGNWRWHTTNASPIHDTSGKVVACMGISRDITERKQAEEMLEKRLVALTQPLEDAEGIAFEDLFDMDEIQRIQDEFANATGVASIITHVDGTPITKPSNFCRLCNDIIRKTDRGRKNCYQSDAIIGHRHPAGPIVQPCLSGGLWDAGASISVGGRHIANWLIGQVRNEAQTEEQMLAYAREIGADEQAFMAAFREVTTMSRKQFEQIAQVLFTLANQLSKSAYQTIQQARFISDRKKAEGALRESERRITTLMSNLPGMAYRCLNDRSWTMEFVSQGCFALTGYDSLDLISSRKVAYGSLIYPEDKETVWDQVQQAIAERRPFHLVYRIRTASGEEKWVWEQGVGIFSENGDRLVLEGFIADITERKRAEEALMQSEERLNNILEIGKIGIWERDLSTGVAWRSSCHDQIFGYTEPLPEWTYETFIGHVLPEDRPEVDENNRRSMTDPVRINFECRIRRVNGEQRWIWVQSNSIINDRNDVVKLTGIVHDITERKNAEEEKRRLEERLHTLVHTIPDLIWLKDADGVYLSCNRMFELFFGANEADIVGKTDYDFVSKDLADFFREHDRKAMALGKPSSNEEWITFASDGHRALLDTIKTPMYDAGGTLIGVLGIGRDITDRNWAEEALRETQRRLTDIIEFLPDATLVIDRDGKVIAWSRAIESMTGVKAEEMLGKGNYEYALPFYGERRPILIDLALHPDKEMENQFTAIQRVGDILFGESFTPNLPPGDIHLSATASILRDSKGEIIAAIECIRDNTERKRLEERLNRAEKMEGLGRLAGGVAHDLNNVLGVLVGYAELLLQKLPEDSPLTKYADYIFQSSMRGATIIQDLLTLARRGVTVSEVVDMNRVIIDYLRTPEFEKLKSYHPNIKVWTELEDGLLNIKGSPVHLSKTIMNLVSNAEEAISDHGEVTIRTENRYLDQPIRGYDDMKEGDYVVLTVSDTGRGIPAQDFGKIFEPFYTKKVMGRSGTGLGLAVVWGAVKDHNGYIDVQSEEGKGTIFSLYFPATREELTKVKKETVTQSIYMGRGESILVVDDVKEQRELAMSMLGWIGYQVEALSSGEEAIIYLKNNKVDLVVLDMIMEPGIDGLETYRRIIEFKPKQKAIIVSGFSETDRVKKALEIGAGSFVRKPYILEKIGLAVKKELDRLG